MVAKGSKATTSLAERLIPPIGSAASSPHATSLARLSRITLALWAVECVLKKLGIEDFRHLTKDKVVALASMYENMDPEVAKKALEQFPEFAQTMREAVGDLKEVVLEGLKANDESNKQCLLACQGMLDLLGKSLEDDELTFEERMQIMDKMMEITKLMHDKDSENKAFVKEMAGKVMNATLGIGVILLAAVGGKFLLDSNGD